jgi:hypothetical protein
MKLLCREDHNGGAPRSDVGDRRSKLGSEPLRTVGSPSPRQADLTRPNGGPIADQLIWRTFELGHYKPSSPIGHYGKFGLPIEHRLPRDAVNCAPDGHYTISGLAYLHDPMSIDQLQPRIPPSLTSQVAVTIRDVTAREMPLVKEDESP